MMREMFICGDTGLGIIINAAIPTLDWPVGGVGPTGHQCREYGRTCVINNK